MCAALLAPMISADDLDDDGMLDTAAAGGAETSEAAPQPVALVPIQRSAATPNESTYSVSQVRMIIGGASEDGKAKVGFLPVND